MGLCTSNNNAVRKEDSNKSPLLDYTDNGEDSLYSRACIRKSAAFYTCIGPLKSILLSLEAKTAQFELKKCFLG